MEAVNKTNLTFLTMAPFQLIYGIPVNLHLCHLFKLTKKTLFA